MICLSKTTTSSILLNCSAPSVTRRACRIISVLLEGEMNVGEIAAKLEMTESAVSHQLRGLRQMRIVRNRKDGRQVYYVLDDDHVVKLYRMGLDHVQHG